MECDVPSKKLGDHLAWVQIWMQAVKWWEQGRQSQIHFAPWTLVLHGFAQVKHRHFRLPQSPKTTLISVGQRPLAGQSSGGKLEPWAHYYSELTLAHLQASPLTAEAV
jgi:hypothetical protein